MLIGTPVIRFSPHLYCNSRIAWIAWLSWSGTHMFTDYPSNWIVNCGLPGLHGFHGMELVCLHLSNWIATCGLPLLLGWHGFYGWEILLEYHLFIWIATIFSSTRVWLFFDTGNKNFWINIDQLGESVHVHVWMLIECLCQQILVRASLSNGTQNCVRITLCKLHCN